MKITPQSRISTPKASVKKSKGTTHFGSLLAAEQHTEDTQNTPTPQANTQEQAASPQPYMLFEQASELLQQALSQLECEQAPSQDTLQTIQDIRRELNQLAQHESHPNLAQAQTILAVEAQRIQNMKH